LDASMNASMDASNGAVGSGRRRHRRRGGSQGRGRGSSTLAGSVLDAFESSAVCVSFGPICGHTDEDEGVVPVRFVDAFLGPVDTCAHSCIHRTSF
jgi:hypothetical protein